MRGFAKVKPSQNGEIILSFIYKGKSCHSRKILTSQKCHLTLFAKIKFPRKFPNLQYAMKPQQNHYLVTDGKLIYLFSLTFIGNNFYSSFLVYCRELVPSTVSITGERAHGDDSKHDSHYTCISFQYQHFSLHVETQRHVTKTNVLIFQSLYSSIEMAGNVSLTT